MTAGASVIVRVAESRVGVGARGYGSQHWATGAGLESDSGAAATASSMAPRRVVLLFAGATGAERHERARNCDVYDWVGFDSRSIEPG